MRVLKPEGLRDFQFISALSVLNNSQEKLAINKATIYLGARQLAIMRDFGGGVDYVLTPDNEGILHCSSLPCLSFIEVNLDDYFSYDSNW